MATATKRKGQKENREKKRYKLDFIRLFGRELPPLRLEEQEFRFTALRRDTGDVNIDRYVESAEWRDEGTEDNVNTIPVLRGTLTVRKPPPGDPGGNLQLEIGHVIRCEVRWRGRWMEVWRMRIQKPSLAVADGAWSFELADDMQLLTKSRGSFSFKKGKRKRRGWRYDEIVRAVCRQYHIPLNRMLRGRKRITNFVHNDISPLEAIRLAVEEERKYRGIPILIAWRYDARRRRSGIQITAMRRNGVLYLLRDQIISATISKQVPAEHATSLIGRGSIKKGKKTVRKKARIRVVSPKGIKRYGFIQKEVKIPGSVESVQEARRELRRDLAKRAVVKHIIEDFTHPGIAFVRRGDAIRISLPEEGFNVGRRKGQRFDRPEDAARAFGVVFVTSVTHSVSAGDYTMQLSLGYKDPLDPRELRKQREKAERARKRKEKGKRR